MKTVIRFFKRVNFKIKNKFFNNEKDDFSRDYEDGLRINKCVESGMQDKEVEEYLKNYTAITRWQTV